MILEFLALLALAGTAAGGASGIAPSGTTLTPSPTGIPKIPTQVSSVPPEIPAVPPEIPTTQPETLPDWAERVSSLVESAGGTITSYEPLPNVAQAPEGVPAGITLPYSYQQPDTRYGHEGEYITTASTVYVDPSLLGLGYWGPNGWVNAGGG